MKNDHNRWHAIDSTIDNWLKNRQELLVKYYAICNLDPFEPSNTSPEELAEFCELLVDYVSAGHFEVFGKLAEAHDLEIALNLDWNKEILIKILRTTMHALDFNDRYARPVDLENLKSSLSVLGEQLSIRMELEDKLIDLYSRITKKELTSS